MMRIETLQPIEADNLAAAEKALRDAWDGYLTLLASLYEKRGFMKCTYGSKIDSYPNLNLPRPIPLCPPHMRVSGDQILIED